MFTKSAFPYDLQDILTIKMNVQETFTELVSEIKRVFGTQMKLIYAYFVPDYDNLHQFILIAKQTRIIKDQKVILYALFPVVKFGECSLEMYHLCKRDGKLDLYYDRFFQEPITLDTQKFNYFIRSSGLSLDKDSDKYWKREENANIVLENAEELGKMNATVLMRHAATEAVDGDKREANP